MGKRKGAAPAPATAPVAPDALLSMPVAFPGDGDGGVPATVPAPAPVAVDALLTMPVSFPGDGGGGGGAGSDDRGGSDGQPQPQSSAGTSGVLEFPAPDTAEAAPAETPADDAEAAVARRIAERDEHQAAEKAAKEAKRFQKEEAKAAKEEAKAAKKAARQAEKAAKKAGKAKGKGDAAEAAAPSMASQESADAFDYEAANRRAERRAATRAAEQELEQQAEAVAASSSLVRRCCCTRLREREYLTSAALCGLLCSSTGQWQIDRPSPRPSHSLHCSISQSLHNLIGRRLVDR